MKALCLAICLFFSAVVGEARFALPPAALLRAHSGKTELWQVMLYGSAVDCKVIAQNLRKHTEKKPGAAECKMLFGLVSSAAHELSAAPNGRQNPPAPKGAGVPMDEPAYGLQVGRTAQDVFFDTERVCTVKPGAGLDCEDHKLSAAQKLLLRLRVYGKSLSRR